MDATDRDFLIRTVIGEAGREPDVGQAAVAHVILNRLSTGKWGDTARDVVLAKNQFEPWMTRAGELMSIAPASPQYRRAAQIVDGVLTGQVEDPTGGATHFLNPDIVRQRRGGSLPEWAQGDGLQIGQHAFYAPNGPVQRQQTALDAINAGLGVKTDLAGAGIQPLAFAATAASQPQQKASAMPKAAPKQDDDVLNLYLKKDAGSPAPQQGGDEDVLNLYLKKDQAPAAAPVNPAAPATASKPLDNAATDDAFSASAKNVATGAVKGLGNAAGVVSNTKNLADYLVARTDSAITGRPVGDVLAQQQAVDQRIANDNPTVFGRIRNAISPTNVLPSAQTVQNWLLEKTGAYQPQSYPAQLVQGATDAVVSSLGPGVRGAPSGLPMAAPVSTIARQAPGIATSAAAGQSVSDATGDPLLGMLASAAPAAAAGAVKVAGNKLTGVMDPQTASLADAARNKYGIPINAGQMSESPFVRFLDSTTKRMPFSGAGESAAQQSQAFNRAVTNTFGENAPKLTPEVMARARDRIGASFDDVAARTPAIHADQTFMTDIQKVIQNAGAAVTEPEMKPIFNQVQNVLGKFQQNGGAITGQQFQALTKSGTPLAEAINSDNSNIANAAKNIKDALVDAMERSAPPEVAQQLQQAKLQWKNLRTVEDLAAKASTGDVSPALLKGRVNANNKGTYGAAYGGGGDLNELANIGQRFLKEPPSSGTAERSGILAMLSAGGAGAESMLAYHNPLMALYAAGVPIATLAAGRATGGVLRSEALANSLLNRSLGRPQAPGVANKLLNLATPALLQAGNPGRLGYAVP